jgi:hypothetical protein
MNPSSRIKFPRDIEFLDDLQLLVGRPRGVLDEGSVNRIIRIVGELEFSRKQPFNRFLDTLEVDGTELNFRFILHISLYRRLSYSGRPPVKSAILATDATAVHYSRLHAMLTQGSPIKVRIFEELKDAAKWLKVPAERLIAQVNRKETPQRIPTSRREPGPVDKGRVVNAARPARHSRCFDEMS